MLDRLFSPLTINGKTLKNRCVVTPMLMNFCEEDGTCTERFAGVSRGQGQGRLRHDCHRKCGGHFCRKRLSVDSGPVEG